jgi:N-acetyl-1-D-myo-inositol-2-amino-2-deoxy-alpha-D-glucopyranoside deacetylase
VTRLLAFVPHPDDESYSFGGTLALAASAGWECHLFCASSGERGKRHDGGPTGRVAVSEARELELQRSCEILGIEPPAFMRLPDGAIARAPGGPGLVMTVLRRFAPDVVLALGQDGAHGHPDHTQLHRWVAHAWSSYPEPRPALLFPVFPQGLFLPQWEKCRHMLGEPPDPPAGAIGSERWHYEVPIGSVRDVKRASIEAHRSHLPGGRAEALVPGGIVQALLDVERFDDATGGPVEQTAGLLAGLANRK